MQLKELNLDAVERRVKAMKSGAKAAKHRAEQLKAQVDVSAQHLETQKSRQKPAQPKGSPSTSTIKPTGPS